MTEILELIIGLCFLSLIIAIMRLVELDALKQAKEDDPHRWELTGKISKSAEKHFGKELVE